MNGSTVLEGLISKLWNRSFIYFLVHIIYKKGGLDSVSGRQGPTAVIPVIHVLHEAFFAIRVNDYQR